MIKTCNLSEDSRLDGASRHVLGVSVHQTETQENLTEWTQRAKTYEAELDSSVFLSDYGAALWSLLPSFLVIPSGNLLICFLFMQPRPTWAFVGV